jgi:hypothetical protein
MVGNLILNWSEAYAAWWWMKNEWKKSFSSFSFLLLQSQQQQKSNQKMGKVSMLILLTMLSQATAANLRSPRSLLEMTMAEDDSTPVQAPRSVVPVSHEHQAVVLADNEEVPVARPAVVPVPVSHEHQAAVLADNEEVPVARPAVVPVKAPVPVSHEHQAAVLADNEEVPVARPAVVPVPVSHEHQAAVLADNEEVPVARPAVVPVPVSHEHQAVNSATATAPSKSSSTMSRSIVSPASPNKLWAASFSKHTTDEALLALFDVAAQLKQVSPNHLLRYISSLCNLLFLNLLFLNVSSLLLLKAYLSFDVNGDGTVDTFEVSEITSPTSVCAHLPLPLPISFHNGIAVFLD